MRKHGFPPSIDKNTKIIIFGTFPGGESLKQKQYYAHRQNQFWKILSRIIGKDLIDMTYDNKLNALLKHNIGIWDVIESCERSGSSDTKILNEKLNDISKLSKCKYLELVCFNGKNQERYIKKHKIDIGYTFPGIKVVTLPSTSPANARLLFEKKLTEWKNAITKIDYLFASFNATNASEIM